MKEKEVLFERTDDILNSLDVQFELALPNENEETEDRESISSAILILLKQNITVLFK